MVVAILKVVEFFLDMKRDQVDLKRDVADLTRKVVDLTRTIGNGFLKLINLTKCSLQKQWETGRRLSFVSFRAL